MSDLKAGRSHKKDRDSISGSPNAAALRKIITTDVDVLQFKSFPVNVYKMVSLLKNTTLKLKLQYLLRNIF